MNLARLLSCQIIQMIHSYAAHIHIQICIHTISRFGSSIQVITHKYGYKYYLSRNGNAWNSAQMLFIQYSHTYAHSAPIQFFSFSFRVIYLCLHKIVFFSFGLPFSRSFEKERKRKKAENQMKKESNNNNTHKSEQPFKKGIGAAVAAASSVCARERWMWLTNGGISFWCKSSNKINELLRKERKKTVEQMSYTIFV